MSRRTGGHGSEPADAVHVPQPRLGVFRGVLLAAALLATGVRAWGITKVILVGQGNQLTFTDEETGTSTTTTHVGDTVRWDWVSGFHSTTGVSGPERWDSGVHAAPLSFTRQFSVPGTNGYLCTVHGAIMSGTIVVLAPAASTISVADDTGAPGARVALPVVLDLAPGVGVVTLQLNLTVVPEGGAPNLEDAILFTGGLATAPSLVLPEGKETVLVGWLMPLSPPLSGRVQLGSIAVPIPASASPASRYRVDVVNPSATSDGQTDVPLQAGFGLLTVTGAATTTTSSTSTTTASTTTSTSSTTSITSTTTTTLPAVTLAVSDAPTIGGSPSCVELRLSNPTAVRAVQGVLTVERDAVTLRGAACADRTAGFSCTANETPAGTIPFVVVDLGGRCIDPGSGPIARICLQDSEAACLAGQSTMLDLSQVEVADCNSQSLGAATQGGTLLCGEELGDCKADGSGVDIFDVLAKIDIVLGRSTPTALQRVLCDDNCDGRIDIFDILREIDVILGRLAHPLGCAVGTPSQGTGPEGARQGASPGAAEPRVVLRGRGGEVVLENPRGPVRGVELTLVPDGGAVAVRVARGTRRTRGFTVAFHQAAPGAAVRVLAVSLGGANIPAGAGRIVRLRTMAGHHGRLRLGTATVAE